MTDDARGERELARLAFTARTTGFTPASLELLSGVECAANARLPEDYRWFLCAYGSGYPAGEASVVTEDGTIAAVDGIGCDLSRVDTYLGAAGFPPGLVPCGADLVGDMFFVALEADPAGSVWWWGYYEGRDPFTELVLVAPTFIDFLARIEISETPP